MGRFLKQLEKYDESLTLKELKETIYLENNIEKEKNIKLVQSIKNEYKDVYLKRYTDTVYGNTLEIIHIEEIIDFHYTENYDKIFNFKGSKLSFSQRDVYFREIEGDEIYHNLSEEELKTIDKLSIEEYNNYFVQYNHIYNMLKNLMNE